MSCYSLVSAVLGSEDVVQTDFSFVLCESVTQIFLGSESLPALAGKPGRAVLRKMPINPR